MPSYDELSVKTGALDVRKHTNDGGAVNFHPGATVDNKAACILYRSGCTNVNATNYDPKATVDDGSCFMKNIKGCLSKYALNFNCTSLDFFKECTLDRSAVPTVHDEQFCNFLYSPPPIASPPHPPAA